MSAEGLLVLGEKRGQGRRPGLLLALEQDRDGAGRSAELREGSASLDEGQELALVVGRATRDDLRTVGTVLELRLERRISPQVQGIDRLHVVVSVEEHVRGVAAVRLHGGDDGRPSVRRLFRRLEPDRRKLRDEPVRRALAIRKMSGDR